MFGIKSATELSEFLSLKDPQSTHEDIKMISFHDFFIRYDFFVGNTQQLWRELKKNGLWCSLTHGEYWHCLQRASVAASLLFSSCEQVS